MTDSFIHVWINNIGWCSDEPKVKPIISSKINTYVQVNKHQSQGKQSRLQHYLVPNELI